MIVKKTLIFVDQTKDIKLSLDNQQITTNPFPIE
jgi:hypothetical protein